MLQWEVYQIPPTAALAVTTTWTRTPCRRGGLAAVTGHAATDQVIVPIQSKASLPRRYGISLWHFRASAYELAGPSVVFETAENMSQIVVGSHNRIESKGVFSRSLVKRRVV